MEEANRYGKISPCMRDTGSMTKPTAEAGSYMAMEMYTRANGKMTKLMAKGSIPKAMVPVIPVNGFRISSRVLALKSGQTAHPTRGKLRFMKNAL